MTHDEHNSIDPMEAQLAKWKPLPVSDSFGDELEKKLASTQLSSSSPVESGREWLVAALALSLLAVLLLISWPEADPVQTAEPKPLDPGTQVTWVAFHQAMAGSDEALDELLDLHSRVLLPHVSDPFADADVR